MENPLLYSKICFLEIFFIREDWWLTGSITFLGAINVLAFIIERGKKLIKT